MVIALLLIAIWFYRKYNHLEKFNLVIEKEIVNVYRYKEVSNLLATGGFTNRLVKAESSNSTEIISEIFHSRSLINDINLKNSIRDIRFKENIIALVIDYEDLEAENRLLNDYLKELGNNNDGLYFKLTKAAINFRSKLKDLNSISEIDSEFSNLLSLINLFLNNRNELLAREIDLKIGEIEKSIKTLDVYSDNYLSTRLLDAFQNFTENYFEFAKKAYEIGVSGDKGLVSRLNNQYSKMAMRLAQLTEIIQSEKSHTENLTFVLIVIVLVLVIGLNLLATVFFINSFNTFTSGIENYIFALSKGQTGKIDYSKIPLETHTLMHSLVAFANKLINASTTATLFASGKTSLDVNREEQMDVFYNAFSKIKQNIDGLNQKVREEQKKQTNMLWIKSGIDKLTEVMRREYENPLLHANEIINMLVKFLNIPIGAIYHLKLEGDKKYVEMMASFAYGKEKQLYKKIPFGEGIIGTAASERKTLNITSVPEGYFKIISGFGETKPKNILISPIKLNEEIYGVIELASLSRFKQEEIDFVEEVCKTVAYSFAISKVYIDTLYQYETVNMEMAQLEAENTSLTNDYEDLNSNYKLALEKGFDNSFIVEKLNEIALIIDLDIDGNIIETNSSFDQFFKTAKMKLIQSGFSEYFMEINASDDIDIEYVWKDARSGIQREIYQKIKLANKEYMLQQYYFPVKDAKGRVKKVKLIAFDITDKITFVKENSIT